MSDDIAPKYRCSECGCDEFMSSLNGYDVFLAQDDALYYQRSESSDDLIEFFCMNCHHQIDDKDINII